VKKVEYLFLLCAGLLAGCDAQTQPAAGPNVPAGVVAAPASPQRAARGLLRFTDSYERGFAEARRERKPMLLFFTAEWCHYCHQMADESFTNPHVVALSEKFICVLVDADACSDVCRQFRVSRFPTIQFLSPSGVLLNRLEGKLPVHKVTMEMQAALQSVARRSNGRPSTIR
jgi:thioredoxin-like negative regulator of GroEL